MVPSSVMAGSNSWANGQPHELPVLAIFNIGPKLCTITLAVEDNQHITRSNVCLREYLILSHWGQAKYSRKAEAGGVNFRCTMLSSGNLVSRQEVSLKRLKGKETAKTLRVKKYLPRYHCILMKIRSAEFTSCYFDDDYRRCYQCGVYFCAVYMVIPYVTSRIPFATIAIVFIIVLSPLLMRR